MSQSTVIPLVVVRHTSTPRSRFSKNQKPSPSFLKVTDEGKRLLRSITAKKVSVIANVGPISSGKSLFSRCLLRNLPHSPNANSAASPKPSGSPRSSVSLYRQGTGFANKNVASFPVKSSSRLSSSVLVSSGSLSTSHTSGIYVNSQPVILSAGHVLLIFDVPGYVPPIAGQMHHTWDDRHTKQWPGSTEDPHLALRFASLALILASTLIVHGRLSRWSVVPHPCDAVVSHDATEVAAWLSPLIHATMRLRWRLNSSWAVPKLTSEELHDLIQGRRDRADSERCNFAAGPASTGNLRPRSPRQSTSGQVKSALTAMFDELKLGLPQLLLLLRDVPCGMANTAAVEELLGMSQGGPSPSRPAAVPKDPTRGKPVLRKSQDALSHLGSGTHLGTGTDNFYSRGSVTSSGPLMQSGLGSGGFGLDSNSGSLTALGDGDCAMGDECPPKSLFWPSVTALKYVIQNMFPSIAVRGLPPPVLVSQEEDAGSIVGDEMKESNIGLLSKSMTLRRNSSRMRVGSRERGAGGNVLDLLSSAMQPAPPRKRSVLDVEAHQIAGNPNAIADVDATSLFDASSDNQINPTFSSEMDKLKSLLFSLGDELKVDPLQSLGFGSKDSLNAHRIRMIMGTKQNSTVAHTGSSDSALTALGSNSNFRSISSGIGMQAQGSSLQQSQPQQKFTTFSSAYKSFNPQYFAYLLDELVDDINIQISTEAEHYNSIQSAESPNFSVKNTNQRPCDDEIDTGTNNTNSPTNTNVSTTASTTTTSPLSSRSRKLVHFPELPSTTVGSSSAAADPPRDSLRSSSTSGVLPSDATSVVTSFARGDESVRSSRPTADSSGAQRRLSSQPTSPLPLRSSVKGLRQAFQSLPRSSVKLPGLTKPPKSRISAEYSVLAERSGGAPSTRMATSGLKPSADLTLSRNRHPAITDNALPKAQQLLSLGWYQAIEAIEFEPWSSIFLMYSAECFPICSVHTCVENAIERCLQPIRKLAEKRYMSSVMDMLKGTGQNGAHVADSRDAPLTERMKKRFPCDEVTVDYTHEIARDAAVQSYQLKVFSIFPEGSSSCLISHSAFSNSEAELASDIRKISHRFRSVNALRSDHHNKKTVAVEFERFVDEVTKALDAKHEEVCTGRCPNILIQKLHTIRGCFFNSGKNNFLENWYFSTSRGPTSEKILAESCLVLFTSVLNWTLDDANSCRNRFTVALPNVPASPRAQGSVESQASDAECRPIDLRYWNPKLWKEEQNNEMLSRADSAPVELPTRGDAQMEDISRRLRTLRQSDCSGGQDSECMLSQDSAPLTYSKTDGSSMSMQSDVPEVRKSFTIEEVVPNDQEDSKNACNLSTDGSSEKDPELPATSLRLNEDVQRELESLQSVVKRLVAERDSCRRRLDETLKIVDEYKSLTKELEERTCNMEMSEYEVSKDKQSLELQLAELKADYYTKSEELQDIVDNCRTAGGMLIRKKNGQKAMTKFLGNFEEGHRLYLSKLFGQFSLQPDI